MRKFLLFLLPSLVFLAILGLSVYQVSANQPLVAYPYPSYLPLIAKPPLPEWIGPDGGKVVSLAIDPTNPQVVYAGTWGAGMFKSTDGGVTWTATNAGLANLFINSLAIDPGNPQVLYAGTYQSKLFKTTNGGQSWYDSSVGIQDQAIVYAIALDPKDSQHIYISTRGVSNGGYEPWNGVIYVTYDGGMVWGSVLSNYPPISWTPQDWAYSLAFDPTNSSRIYAAMHEHALLFSPDWGASWKPVAGPLDDWTGRAVLVDPQSPHTLYYGSWHTGGVLRSDDQGETWNPKSPPNVIPKVYSLVMDPQQSKTVYLVSFTDGIFRTLDRGDTWSSKGLSSEYLYSLAVDPKNSQVLYSGTGGNGLFKSVNGGTSWAHSQFGLHNTSVTGLVISPLDPNELIAATLGGGVWHSTDNGTTWQEFNTGLGDLAVQALSQRPDQPTVLFALTSNAGLYRRNLGTDTAWSAVNSGLPLAKPQAEPDPSVWEVLEDPSSQAVAAPNAVVSLQSLTFAPQSPAHVYMGADGGLFRSLDGGFNWVLSGLEGVSVRSVAVDPTNTDHWFAATDQDGGIYTTSNGGNSYQFVELPSLPYMPKRKFNLLTIFPSQPGVVYAGTDIGVYRLENDTWYFLGLYGKNILSLAMHPTRAGQIFAGTTSGSYFSLDGGSIWNTSLSQLDALGIQGFTFDPTRPGRMYFNTQTQGSVRYDFVP